LNQVNNQDDDRNYEQEMDQTAANVAKKAKKPEHDQDNNYSPEHGIPFGWVKLSRPIYPEIHLLAKLFQNIESYCRQSQHRRLELGLRRSFRHGVAAKWGFSNVLRNLAPDFLQYLSKTPNQWSGYNWLTALSASTRYS
jgi:hypothetical protein